METYGYQYDGDSCDDLEECTRNWTDDEISCGKIVQTGWPMDYMKTTLAPYKNLSKRDLILFPHRIAPEKQVDIFRDLALSLPQYEFVVCQDTTLSKREYHTLLGESKVVFSASIQETLGIVNCSEGPLLNSIPFCPDRLSYAEIFSDFSEFLYPSEWTEDWDSYLLHKDAIMARLCYVMEHYDEIQPRIETYIENTYKNYFESDALIANLLRL
jgi:glycosyltransferase involved in cell wall biosynthesis